ncbi:YbaB/EbfC family nucleoid-associated protein [Spirillospora sp. NPDC048819]|uniref:YbaB/EbfC family nucleoid-associated protein n=1 Tax=Spirillospora sp. NPDC048819 TaxID=3155268 RepID=UPI0033C2E723
MAGIPGSELEHLLDETRAVLGTRGASGGEGSGERSGGASAEASAKGHGEAAGGLVRATVSAGGEIESIDLAPRAMRMPAEEIGEHVAEAVNAAFQGLRADPARLPAGADTEQLTARARAVQDMSMRQMQQMTQSIADLMAQLHGGRR